MVELGHRVFGIDNLNRYYDVQLKLDRLGELGIVCNETCGPETLHRRVGIALPAPRPRRRQGSCGPLRGTTLRRGMPPGGAGRRPLLAQRPVRLHLKQRARLPERPRSVPPDTGAPPGLRFVQFGVRA